MCFVPQVCCLLSCAAHHLFGGRGRRAGPLPVGVTVCAPSAPTFSGCRTHGIPSRLLSLSAHTSFSRPLCRVCVKHSCAGRLRAQNAVLTLLSLRGSVVSAALPGTRLQLAGIGRYCRLSDRCSPKTRFSVNAELPASAKVHHGVAAPLES